MFNPSALSLWGREPAIGAEVWCGALGLREPDGTPIPRHRAPAALAVRDGRPCRADVVVERPDGSCRHVLAYPQPIRDVLSLVGPGAARPAR